MASIVGEKSLAFAEKVVQAYMFNELKSDCEELVRILTAIVKKKR